MSGRTWILGHAEDMRRQRAATVWIAAGGTALVIAYAGLVALQILVLNPLAAAPGKSLTEIEADMAAMNESLGAGFVLGILGFGVLLALFLLVLLAMSRDATPIAAAYSYLAMIMLGAPVYWVASFGAGMGLADTYGISGGDHSGWALVLYLTSLAALVAIVGLLAVRSGRRDATVEGAAA